MASKARVTPKAIIHKKFGATASYRVEEVHDEPSQSSCPGLAIPQKGPCLYRCHLELPDFTVVSNPCKKKKDSEQAAAELAIEKLGIRPRNDDLTVDQAWDDVVGRIKYIFSDEFLSAEHPLGGHLRAALKRDGDCCGSVPVSVLATCDSKLYSRCKIINPSVESDPFLVFSYVIEAAAKLSDCIVASPNVASLRRKDAYPSEIVEALPTHASDSPDSIKFEAVHIPCIDKEIVEPVTLNISSDRYYLDVIAEKLGLKDGSQVMISRTFGKGSCGVDCRLYSTLPNFKSSEASGGSNEEVSHNENSRNARASYICGQEIHGNAILASVGYHWKSDDIDFVDVSVKSFYRICCGMSPNGIYQLSRQSVLASQLPFSFTTKSNWRGPFPKEILSIFCQRHRLAEPAYSVSTAPVKLLSDIFRSHKKLKISELDEASTEKLSKGKEDKPGFRCEVKILTKSQDLVLECSPRKFYEKENEAIQNASLKALLWFSKFFDNLDVEGEDSDDDQSIQSSSTDSFVVPPISSNKDSSEPKTTKVPSEKKSDQSITKGSVVSICYSLSLGELDESVSDGESPREDEEYEMDTEYSKDLIESNEEIEFEIGTGAMDMCLEATVTRMTVGEHTVLNTKLSGAAEPLILAVASDTAGIRPILQSEHAYLDYSIVLLGVKGPTEERMEAAFFKPPLSKQRVQYALKHIRESSASTLVDFGCGSGSLLDSLLDYQSPLQTIIGVDISVKGLARAAKMLHSKLNKEAYNIKSATLYDGSILEFDSRLYDVDIGTCLEVIEHMEEDQASEFGEKVLSLFRPKLLIVSTPNYEYNTILQRSTPKTEEEKAESDLPKFRNYDHKFEWTREQFNQWASKLAELHKYSVEFSGVGGFAEVEPGFASQIAVFRREASSVDKVVQNVADDPVQDDLRQDDQMQEDLRQEDPVQDGLRQEDQMQDDLTQEDPMQDNKRQDDQMQDDPMQPYKVIWEWKKGSEETKD